MAARNILCDGCAQELRATLQRSGTSSSVRVVHGYALSHVFCSACDAQHFAGSPCAAVTILAPGEVQGDWEARYIRPRG